ncbi:MAG: hypothetical protein JSW27_20875 [Phycisphaerales bacterium]|nr:MAG: hypothetical protein JSW27_20875 [Phycisphaerales bacterium]
MNERSQTTTKRKFRFWHVIAIVALALITAFVIFRLAGRAKLNGRFESMRAAGYPVTLTELDAWYEMPPYGENAAEYIVTAISYLRIPDALEAENLPLFHRGKLPPRTQPWDKEMQALIGQVLDDNEKVLELLDQATALPSSRYPVDLSQGHASLLPHISDLRKVVYLLCFKAFLEAEQGRAAAAIDALAGTFHVADSLTQEPVMISQLVRWACQSVALSATERVINRTALALDDLDRLGAILSTAYDPNATIRGLAGERCMAIQMLRQPGALGLPSVLGNREQPSLLQIRVAGALGQVDRYLTNYIDLTERQIAAMRLPAHERERVADEIDTQASQMRNTHKALAYFLPALGRFVEIDLANLTRLRVAHVAVAVERYRVAHGRLPDQWNELVPAYLETAPTDPYDGQPLRYRKLAAGFAVYSIGEDLSDDGGRERPPRKRGSQPESNYDIPFIVER